MQRERHPKFELTLIRKTRTNSSDFALKFTSYFLKPELPVPKNKIYDVIQFFQWFTAENRKHYFRFFITKNRRYDLLKNLL